MPASRASPVVVVLDLIVAKQTDLIAALAWPEVLVSHVHVLHTEWAACHVTDASGLMSDGNAGQASMQGDSQSPSSIVLETGLGLHRVFLVKRWATCPVDPLGRWLRSGEEQAE